jgi:hypothetical protein
MKNMSAKNTITPFKSLDDSSLEKILDGIGGND